MLDIVGNTIRGQRKDKNSPETPRLEKLQSNDVEIMETPYMEDRGFSYVSHQAPSRSASPTKANSTGRSRSSSLGTPFREKSSLRSPSDEPPEASIPNSKPRSSNQELINLEDSFDDSVQMISTLPKPKRINTNDENMIDIESSQEMLLSIEKLSDETPPEEFPEVQELTSSSLPTTPVSKGRVKDTRSLRMSPRSSGRKNYVLDVRSGREARKRGEDSGQRDGLDRGLMKGTEGKMASRAS
jgi:hypothetical protein